MSEDLISVIIPIYNVEKFLKYSLESVINQTYKNLEIILINDGSTDASKEICKEYEQKDKRIKLINQDNKGISAARNIGLKVASGEYIGFLDADDVISAQFFECLYKLIKQTAADIAECAFIRISEKDLFDGKTIFDNIDNLNYITTNSFGALNRINNEETYIIGKSIVVWNKLYKKDLFNEIQFPVGKRYEDDFTTYKLFNKINKLVSTEKRLYNYVQRQGSIMNSEFSITRLEAIEVFENYEKFFQDYKDKYLYVKCLVRYVRMLYKILEELNSSKYEEKEKIRELLKNKFEIIYDKLQSNLDGLNEKELTYVKENSIYYDKFYRELKKNK